MPHHLRVVVLEKLYPDRRLSQYTRSSRGKTQRTRQKDESAKPAASNRPESRNCSTNVHLTQQDLVANAPRQKAVQRQEDTALGVDRIVELRIALINRVDCHKDRISDVAVPYGSTVWVPAPRLHIEFGGMRKASSATVQSVTHRLNDQ